MASICLNRHPIPEPEGVRTAQELHLADKMTEALASLSILVVEFSADEELDAARTVLAGELVKRQTDLDVRFTGPEKRHGAPERSPQILTTAFDEPIGGLEIMTDLASEYPEDVSVRAVLVAGIAVSEFDKEHVNRLFARTLHNTRQIIEEAEPRTLVFNERAHGLLGDRPGIEPSDSVDGHWVMSLVHAPEPTTTEGESNSSGNPPVTEPDPEDTA